MYITVASALIVNLQLQPGGRLVTCVVSLCPAQPLLTVGGVSRGALTDEGPRGPTQRSVQCIYVGRKETE